MAWAVFLHAVYPAFAAGRVGLAGRQDDLAFNFIGAFVEIFWSAFAQDPPRPLPIHRAANEAG
ncbi:MAG: hypothetical protein M5U34_00405 [Chloroflexi bacterium]|nr:hypothetical protein [Chloroflexota bacterium]